MIKDGSELRLRTPHRTCVLVPAERLADCSAWRADRRWARVYWPGYRLVCVPDIRFVHGTLARVPLDIHAVHRVINGTHAHQRQPDDEL